MISSVTSSHRRFLRCERFKLLFDFYLWAVDVLKVSPHVIFNNIIHI